MPDLISREKLIEDLSYCAPELFLDKDYLAAKIAKQPAVDAVPVDWLQRMAGIAEMFGEDKTVTLIRTLITTWQTVGYNVMGDDKGVI